MARLAVMPEAWLVHPDVGVDEIAILAVLALHANRGGSCFPSQGHLASIVGRSRSWVSKVISRLVEIGLVVRTHRHRHDGGDRSCLYHLIGIPQHSSAVSKENTGCADRNTVKVPKEINGTHPASAPETQSSPNLQIQAQPSDLSEDWQPSDQDLVWAIDRFPSADLQALTDRFIQRCRAKGYRYRDVSAAWRSWLIDDLTPGASPRLGAWGDRNQKRVAAENRLAAWAGVAAQAKGDRRAAA